MTTLTRRGRLAMGIGLAVCAVGIYYSGVRPVLRFRAAAGWLASRCEVLSSGVKSQYDEGHQTYTFNVTYRYQVDGKTFTSAAYDLFSGSSTGCNDDREVAPRFRVGSSVPCYVNPRNLREAVLNRRLPPETALVLIPLLVTAMFAAALVANRRPRQVESRGPSGEQLAAPSVVSPVLSHAARKLTPFESRPTKTLALAGVTAIAAGACWSLVRVVHDLAAIGRRGTIVEITLSLIPVVVLAVISLVMGRVVVRIALELLSADVELSLSPPLVRAGDPARIEWNLQARESRVASLQIWLRGYDGRDGRESKTAAPFYRQPLLNVSGAAASGKGQVDFIIPGPRPEWPPVECARWSVWVHLHAPPLPKVVTGYELHIADGDIVRR